MSLLQTLARGYGERRFTVLFAAVFLAIAGHGLVGRLLPVGNPLELLLGASLVAVVFSAPSGRLRWLLGATAAASIAAKLAQTVVDHPAPLVVSQSMLGLTCLLAAGAAVRRALAAGPVDVEHIAAALDAYLLVGLAFGTAYFLLEAVLPGSFASTSGGAMTPPRAIYFSFVTQATLGFGDIVPLTEDAEGLVVAQGIGGQMYLAVLVARLVSLFAAQEKS